MKQIFTLKEGKNSIHTANNLFENIDKINIDYTRENVILFCLDTKNRVIYSEIVHIGGLDACVVDPKTIYRIALLKNASSIMLAHNHPSNDLIPSIEDKNVFKLMKEAGKIITLECLDSIIFNEREFYSLNSEGKKEEIF